MRRKTPPYNTGKVLIGARWQPPAHKMSPEEEFIQSILLGYPMPFFNLRRITRTLMYVMLFLFFVSISFKGASHARPPI